MINKIIKIEMNNQIDNNETYLELLNLKLNYYQKLFNNSTRESERKNYTQIINEIYIEIENTINLISNIQIY